MTTMTMVLLSSFPFLTIIIIIIMMHNRLLWLLLLLLSSSHSSCHERDDCVLRAHSHTLTHAPEHAYGTQPRARTHTRSRSDCVCFFFVFALGARSLLSLLG